MASVGIGLKWFDRVFSLALCCLVQRKSRRRRRIDTNILKVTRWPAQCFSMHSLESGLLERKRDDGYVIRIMSCDFSEATYRKHSLKEKEESQCSPRQNNKKKGQYVQIFKRVCRKVFCNRSRPHCRLGRPQLHRIRHSIITRSLCFGSCCRARFTTTKD